MNNKLNVFLTLTLCISTICWAGKTDKDWQNFQSIIDRVNAERDADEQEELDTDIEERSKIYSKREPGLRAKSAALATKGNKELIFLNHKVKDFSPLLAIFHLKIEESKTIPEQIGHINQMIEFMLEKFEKINEDFEYCASFYRKAYKASDRLLTLLEGTTFDNPKDRESFIAFGEMAKKGYGLVVNRHNSMKNEDFPRLLHAANEMIISIEKSASIDYNFDKIIELMFMLNSAGIKPIDFSHKNERVALLADAAQEITQLVEKEEKKSILLANNNNQKNTVVHKKTMPSNWEVVIPKRLNKSLEFDFRNQADAFDGLINYLKDNGPKIQPQYLLASRLKNYGLLGQDLYHCHIGTSQKVVVWKAFPKENRIVFYYIGNHPGDNYKQLKANSKGQR